MSCWRQASAVLFFSAALLGCDEENVYAPPPPPAVSTAVPLKQNITEYLEFTGTTESVASVEVRARISGFLESKHFTPGTQVEEGDLLFVIDPREYEADLQASQAELEGAVTQLNRSQTELERAEKLFEKQAGSEFDVVKWKAERDVGEAAIVRAEAAVERAELNLSYTKVVAPISGRVGRNLVDPGNLVGESEATLLTTITDARPIYVYFNLNERDLLRVLEIYRAELEKKGADPEREGTGSAEIPLQLGLANEEGYPHVGALDYADSKLDPQTGTLQLRGVFSNEEVPPRIVPGLFARVRMPIQERADALLVSERAVASDQGGRYVLVVDGDGVVEKRSIQTGQRHDGLFVVEQGLAPNDRVVVNGLQRARPGAKVAPEDVDMASLSATAIRAAAGGTDDGTDAAAGGGRGDGQGESPDPQGDQSQ